MPDPAHKKNIGVKTYGLEFCTSSNTHQVFRLVTRVYNTVHAQVLGSLLYVDGTIGMSAAHCQMMAKGIPVTITGDRSKYDKILKVKKRKYIGFRVP